jgi:hypothetical protein
MIMYCKVNTPHEGRAVRRPSLQLTDMKKREQEVGMIQIRIAPDQKRLLEEAARKMGLSLSAWIRLVALKAEREQRSGGK